MPLHRIQRARAQSKTLDRLVARDPRVVQWWSEGEDGYWVELAPGYLSGECTSCIHEWTVQDVLAQVSDIERQPTESEA